MISLLAAEGAGYHIHKGSGRTGAYKHMYTPYFGDRHLGGYYFDNLPDCLLEIYRHYSKRLASASMRVCPECEGVSANFLLDINCPTCGRTGVVNMTVEFLTVTTDDVGPRS